MNPEQPNLIDPAHWQEGNFVEIHRYDEITDLPPDLRNYYEANVGGGMGRFCHPLYVFPIPMVCPGPIEDFIAHLQGMLDDSLARRKFGDALFLIIQRPWRSDKLHEWDARGLLGEGRRADERYWKLVGEAWTDSEGPFNTPIWRALLSSPRQHSEAIMNRNERQVLANMGPTITAYRGVSAKNAKRAAHFIRDGNSWTVDKERAVWFARRYASNREEAYIAEAQIPHEAILAYLTDRTEAEILTRPMTVMLTNIVKV
jgi:hypothetical protein